MHEMEHIESEGEFLHAHHKDGRSDAIDNLITLCAEHHRKVDGMRSEHVPREFGGSADMDEVNEWRRDGIPPVWGPRRRETVPINSETDPDVILDRIGNILDGLDDDVEEEVVERLQR